MEERYFVVVSGKPLGPFSLEEMKNMQIREDTFVKTQAMSDYKEACELPELCSFFGFKQTRAQPQYFASLDMRLLAAVIDYLIIFSVYLIVILSVISFFDTQYLKVAVALSFLPVIPVCKFFLNVFMEASRRQGTWGKSLMSIKVTSDTAERLTLGQSFFRNICKITCVVSFGIGYLAGFFDRRQQCWHDKLAHTLVVKDRLI